MKPGGSRAGDPNRFLDHGAHAALVDVAHGEGMNAGVLHVVALLVVHGANPDQRDIRRIHLGRIAEDARSAPRGPTPMQHASGIPCTLPLGLVSGVFMSVCASIQIMPELFASLAKVLATRRRRCRRRWNDRRPAPAGTCPRASACSTISANRAQVSAICGRYFACGWPSGWLSGCTTGTLPRSPLRSPAPPAARSDSRRERRRVPCRRRGVPRRDRAARR